MPTFFLDEQEIEFEQGEDILRACLRAKKFIPHYCAHESLSRVATCRMCLVDVVDAGNGRAMPKLQTSCSTPAAAGMKVQTQNEKVKLARNAVMEFLLINHPLDCSICDQAGECDLQDFSFEYGTGKSLVKHEKRVYGWRDIGSFLQLERNRCVHCTRCVRFTQEVTGTHEMGVFGRNYQLKVDTFFDYPLSDLFQGNLADICPVGAITTKDFRFKKRVWMEKKTPSICAGCSTGCNIHICHHKGQVYRFLPRENMEVNKWWMCDLGRLSFHRLIDKEKRQLYCLHQQQKVAWQDAIRLAAAQIKNLKTTDKVVIFPSNQSTNEEIQALKNFCDSFLPQAEFYKPKLIKESNPNKTTKFIETLITSDKAPNSTGLDNVVFTKQKSLEKFKNNNTEISFALIIGDFTQFDWIFSLLNNVNFIWHLANMESIFTKKANLVMPNRTHLEKTGHFTNKNGIIQKNTQAIPAIAGKDEETIFTEVAYEIEDNDDLPSKENIVFDKLSEQNNHFKKQNLEIKSNL